MKKIVLLLVSLLLTSLLFAGPFGLEFDWTEKDLKSASIPYRVLDNDSGIAFLQIYPDKDHPLLSDYYVSIDKKYGLFLVRAESDVMEDEYDIRYVFNTLLKQLSTVYGEPYDIIDYIDSDSVWDDTYFFSQSIYYGDRALVAVWYPEEGEGEPSVVALGVQATPYNTAYVVLEYESQNRDKAVERYELEGAEIL